MWSREPDVALDRRATKYKTRRVHSSITLRVSRYSTMETSSSRKRRPRSQPTPIGRRTKITDNDMFGIFEPLSRHTQLTTKQLVAFDRRHASNTRNRLTDLYHHQGAWLVRSSEKFKLANAILVDELYQLGKDAEALLQARGIIPNERWVRTARVGGNSTAPSRIFRLAHDLMASQIALDIEIGARQAKHVRFRNHIEIIRDAPERTQGLLKPLRVAVPPIHGAPRWIVPDAVFAVDDRLFAIEADTGSESIEATIKPKIRAYREIVATRTIDDHFGFDNLRVLFVTTSEKRMRNMMAAVASIARNGRSTMFGFACRPDLRQFSTAAGPDGQMFSLAWQRVGFDPIALSE
jgi:Replication-relaxation